MAVKRYPVERIFVYKLFCDFCGTEMVKGNVAKLSNPPTYEYRCPNCRAFHLSKLDFPVTKYKLDEMLPAEIKEEDIK